MERTDKRHMEEALNLRSFYLRLIKKIWLVPLAAVIGAVLAGGIYTLVTVTFGPEKSYYTESKLYIKFAYDEQAGTMVDWYNAYTWGMLMSTDEILDVAMDNLQDKTIERQEVIDSVTAEVPSDVRLLLITVKNSDINRVNEITDAIDKSLESYGNTNEAFDSIKLIGKTEGRLVTYTDRTLAAVIFGAAFGGIAVVLIMLLLDALDDAVYVPEDAEKRYDLPVLGVLFKDKNDKDSVFVNELTAALEKNVFGAESVQLISSDSIKDDSISSKDLLTLNSALGDGYKEQLSKISAMSVPGSVLDNYRKIGTSDGVILAIPYGAKNGTMNEHIIAQLKKHDCPILGILMVRADEKFIKKYYRIK